MADLTLLRNVLAGILSLLERMDLAYPPPHFDSKLSLTAGHLEAAKHILAERIRELKVRP